MSGPGQKNCKVAILDQIVGTVILGARAKNLVGTHEACVAAPEILALALRMTVLETLQFS